MKYLFLTIIALALFAVSCKKDQVPVVAPYPEGACVDTVSFNQVIKPLIEQSCATTGCHDANTAQSGFNYTGHFNISLFSSPMIGSIKHNSGFAPMPFSAPKLADSLIQKIECWIAQGKLNN